MNPSTVSSRRSSKRKSSSGGSASSSNMSSHPSYFQVDATTISTDNLRRKIDEAGGNKSSLLLERLDFIHISDDIIIELFLQDCYKNRQASTSTKILLPPI